MATITPYLRAFCHSFEEGKIRFTCASLSPGVPLMVMMGRLPYVTPSSFLSGRVIRLWPYDGLVFCRMDSRTYI